MNTPKLRGWMDIVYIVAISLIVAVITGFLLEHLTTRHEMFVTARERSLVAYRVRQLKEEARHLRLEERIRASKIQKGEAPKESQRAPAERTVGMEETMGAWPDAAAPDASASDEKKESEGTP